MPGTDGFHTRPSRRIPPDRATFGAPMLHALLRHDHIAIQCPDAPDADSIACAFALRAFFLRAGKSVVCFYAGESPVGRPNLVEMLNQVPFPLEHLPGPRDCPGALLMLNCQPGGENVTPAHCGHVAVLGCHRPLVPLPDASDVRPHLSACATLVWLLLKEAGCRLTVDAATLLLYALDVASNDFAEIRFPLDRDMRDELLLMLGDNVRGYAKLKRSNLSLRDLALSAQALHTVEYHPEGHFVLLNVLPCDPSIPGFLCDLALRVHSVDVAVAFSESADALHFSVRSGIRETKARELAGWLAAGYAGTTGGDAEKAGGGLARTNGRAWPELSFAFFLERLNTYFSAYDILDCALGRKFSTQGMRAFQKLPVTLGYVPCKDLFPERSRLRIRMLEGDITVRTTPGTYLMIGTAGEVYPIEKSAFERLHSPLDAPLQQDFAYPPAVLEDNTMNRVELAQAAKQCLSKEGRVLARQLTRGIKIFTTWDSGNYIKGEPGDWLVMRKENHADQYVITGELFPRLYRPVSRDTG